MYTITTLSGGKQILLGQKPEIIEAVELAVGQANKYLNESKKTGRLTVSKTMPNDSLAPENAVAKVVAWYPSHAHSQRSFWVIAL